MGGDKGDAFIAFTSDEDARKAMYMDGGFVKDARIKLFLSSKSEMQNVIEMARGMPAGAPPAGAGPGPDFSNPPPVSMAGGGGQLPQFDQGMPMGGLGGGVNQPGMGPTGGFGGPGPDMKDPGLMGGNLGGFNQDFGMEAQNFGAAGAGEGLGLPGLGPGRPDRMGPGDGAGFGGGPNDRMGLGGPPEQMNLGGGPGERLGMGGPGSRPPPPGDRIGGPGGPGDRMGGFNDRMGGPSDRMGGLGDRMGGPNDRMGGPADHMGDRMGGLGDRMGGPGDRMGGPGDRMGGPGDRMGGPGDRMGGPTDRMGGPVDRMGGPGDRMGGPGDRMGGPGDRMGGPGNRMGGPGDRMGGPSDRMGGPGNRMGGPGDRMGGPGDRMGGPGDKMGGPGPEDRMGQTDRFGPGGRAGGDRLGFGGRMGPGDRMGPGEWSGLGNQQGGMSGDQGGMMGGGFDHGPDKFAENLGQGSFGGDGAVPSLFADDKLNKPPGPLSFLGDKFGDRNQGPGDNFDGSYGEENQGMWKKGPGGFGSNDMGTLGDEAPLGRGREFHDRRDRNESFGEKRGFDEGRGMEFGDSSGARNMFGDSGNRPPFGDQRRAGFGENQDRGFDGSRMSRFDDKERKFGESRGPQFGEGGRGLGMGMTGGPGIREGMGGFNEGGGPGFGGPRGQQAEMRDSPLGGFDRGPQIGDRAPSDVPGRFGGMGGQRERSPGNRGMTDSFRMGEMGGRSQFGMDKSGFGPGRDVMAIEDQRSSMGRSGGIDSIIKPLFGEGSNVTALMGNQQQGLGGQGGDLGPRGMRGPGTGKEDSWRTGRGGMEPVRGRSPPRGLGGRGNSPPRGFQASGFGGRDGFDNKRPHMGDGPRDRKRSRGPEAHLFMNGLPISANYKEIRRFFTGCEIPHDGLKLINDRHGRRIGQAFVKFISERDCHEALKRDGRHMMDRRVRLRHCSLHEFDEAVDSYIPGSGKTPPAPERKQSMDRHDPSPARRVRSRSPAPRKGQDSNDRCVTVSNVPYRLEKFEINSFFGGCRVAGDGGPFIDRLPDGKASGNVFVEFDSKKDFQKALEMDRKLMKGRTVNVLPLSKAEFEKKVSKYRDEKKKKDEKSPDRKAEKEKTDKEKPKEEPKVSSTKAEKDAKEKNEKEKSAKTESRSKADTQQSDQPQMKYYCVKMSGLPWEATNADVTDFFGGLEIASRGLHLLNDKRAGSARGTAFVEFVTTSDCKKALDKNNQYIGSRYIEVKPITKRDMLMEISQSGQSVRYGGPSPRGGGPSPRGGGGPSPRGGGPSSRGSDGPGGMRSPPNPGSQSRMSGSGTPQGRSESGTPQGRMSNGQPSRTPTGSTDSPRNTPTSGPSQGRTVFSSHSEKTVTMSNLPANVRMEDIMAFFRGLQPIQDSIRLRYSKDGTPTGDAICTFNTPQDASRAIRELNRKLMMGRAVFLTLGKP